MLNRVILMGRLVADPELKTTQSGIGVTSFRIAVERSYAKAGEERQTDFINIVCWRNTAEFVCKYFPKGSLIALEGQLQTRSYQDKDGTTRYTVEVLADKVSFTGEKTERQESKPQSYPAPTAAPTVYASGSDRDFEEMPLDDDLPF